MSRRRNNIIVRDSEPMPDAEIERLAHVVASVVLDTSPTTRVIDLAEWFTMWHQGTPADGVRIWARAIALVRDAVTVPT